MYSRHSSRSSPTQTDRAASTTLSYVLALGITAILITGLLVAGGGVVEDQRDRTVENELRVIGQQLAADLEMADALVQSAPSGTVRLDRQLPPRVVGTNYAIDMVDTDDDGSANSIQLSTSNPDLMVTVSFTTHTTIADASFSGGNVNIRYTGTKLVIENA
ncbi:hypothetical protein [Haloprofundus sp. MHR1]|uniref:DUF7266 family protein n=1 Tax=Haloprofundus sp. MHR1 TaxID=2572921 RepID=UPI0010BE4136|nr:hypothetical protein [Haloprofundus sp. MHR1]QCJ47858.1 hypothetical protein FCF25_12355 [Haloprofundus sp. MHR1]